MNKTTALHVHHLFLVHFFDVHNTALYVYPWYDYPWICCFSCRQNIYFCLLRGLIRQK